MIVSQHGRLEGGRWCNCQKYSHFRYSTLAASILPLATAYSVCEGLGLEAGLDRPFGEAQEFCLLYTAIVGLNAGVILVPGTPLLRLIIVSQVINGVLLPFVIVFMLLLVNKRSLVRDYTDGPAYNLIAWATVVVLIALTVLMLVTGFLPGAAWHRRRAGN